MPAIEIKTQIVYYAPTRKRRYFSRAGAIRAEAIAVIKSRYPTEQPEYMPENGMQTYSGFHWSELPNSKKLLRRVIRLINKVSFAK